MIAFLRRWFHNRFVVPAIQKQRDAFLAQFKHQEQMIENLSRAKENSPVSGALSREVYEAKVLKQMDNTIITSTDTPSSTAFKMGVQHALRVMEREVVV